MASYVVRPGCRHGAAQQYGPGDEVELTPEEAAAFADKLDIFTGLLARDSAESASPSDSAESILPVPGDGGAPPSRRSRRTK